jgi:prephenate dehydrogenase (NADP+)
VLTLIKFSDQITADTQAVTHVAFMSMGAAWKTRSTFPWENNRYLGGIDNVKILTTLRIFSNKWHVYAGLAIMNPSARFQVQQYAKSVSQLFTLMIQEKRSEFEDRIRKADSFVFGDYRERKTILLSDSILDQFSLSIIPMEDRKPNSHLSLLAMVDCWMNLGIRPYQHLICQTPPFRLLLGIAEYLFSRSDFLDEAIDAAISCKEIRADDLEFYRASISWVELIQYQNTDGYKKKFEEISEFFGTRIIEARAVILFCLT